MSILNMSCGQTDHHPDVMEVLGRQVDGPIYYPPYWELELDTIELVRQIMGTKNDILLIAGSGTYGVEAACSTLLEPQDKVIVVDSGKYGQLLADLVDIVGGEAIKLTARRGEAVGVSEIREALRAHPEATMVAATHCDTSSGVMTPIDRVGQMLAEEFPNRLYLVDAISSLGGAPVEVDGWGIDICCSTAQKCLNGPQGLAIVSVSDRFWELVDRRQDPIPTLCLDLKVWKDYHDGVRQAYESGVWGDVSAANRKAIHGPSPSYVLVAGIRAAVQAVLDEGLERVLRRHEMAGRAVRAG